MELVLQLSALSGQRHVHSRPEIPIDDLAVAGQLRLPACLVAASEVVDLSGGALFALQRDVGIAAEESQRQDDLMRGRLDRRPRGESMHEQEHDLFARQKERVARPMREVAYPRVRLALVLHEGEWQLAVRVQQISIALERWSCRREALGRGGSRRRGELDVVGGRHRGGQGIRRGPGRLAEQKEGTAGEEQDPAFRDRSSGTSATVRFFPGSRKADDWCGCAAFREPTSESHKKNGHPGCSPERGIANCKLCRHSRKEDRHLQPCVFCGSASRGSVLEVRALDLELLAVDRRAGEDPLGHSAVAGHEVACVTKRRVREDREHSGERLAHTLAPRVARAAGLRTRAGFEDAVIGHEGHQGKEHFHSSAKLHDVWCRRSVSPHTSGWLTEAPRYIAPNLKRPARRRRCYCTLALTEAAPVMVNVHVFALLPAVGQAPDQIASRPFDTLSVIEVPVANVAVPVLPTATLSPSGLEVTRSPVLPVAVTVSVAD